MRTARTIEGVDGSLGFLRGFSRYQWLVFFVAWAGWSLDATDFGLFSLVLRPALTELLGGQPSVADIGRVGGILSTVGLLGWSLGGFVFGIIADYIGRVRALAMLAEPLPAATAAEWGLIWQMVEDDRLMPEARALAARLATQATTALALTKRALDAAATNPLDRQLDLERDLQAEAGASPDHREGVRAFLDKRAPVFTGRLR